MSATTPTRAALLGAIGGLVSRPEPAVALAAAVKRTSRDEIAGHAAYARSDGRHDGGLLDEVLFQIACANGISW